MEVTIRPLGIQDAYTSVKWRNDPQVFKYTGNTYSHEITIDSELAWIERVIGNEDEYRCAIEVDGVYVGNIYLTGIHNGTAEYHIFIGNRDYWGKSVARKASELIIEYGFNLLHLKSIHLEVRKDNTRAICLYSSLGFREVKCDNQWIHMVINH